MGVLSVCLVGNKIEFGFQNNELLRLNSLIIRDEPTQLAIAEKNRVEPAHHEDRMEIFVLNQIECPQRKWPGNYFSELKSYGFEGG